eukprot:10698621-Ditylum_brightwellii.AAC.1
MVKYYKVGTLEEWLQFVDAITQRDALQVFQNEEESQDAKDGSAFTICLVAVTEHIFLKKAYKVQKKDIWYICKPPRLGSCMTTAKISREEFVEILEDGILYQWKLELKKR